MRRRRCSCCLALLAWRPQWSNVIAATESAYVIGALVIGMMTKFMSINESIFIQSSVNFGFEDVVNFIISGLVAYGSWLAAFRRLKVR
jgi:mannitol-specific phosphotransferase system IIBC component